MDGVGNVVRARPDQARPQDARRSTSSKELLDPSARINEKFQTYVFELDSGKVVTGLVLEETPDKIKVIENPLAKADADRAQAGGHRQPAEVALVDHAQGPARQALARGDSGPDRLRPRPRQPGCLAVPGRHITSTGHYVE